MTDDKSIMIDGHEIGLSNQDKILFPDDGLTKGDLVDYYRRIAATALPHFRGRPLTMERFPDGIGEDGFFQKQAGAYFPDWIDRVELPKEDGTVAYVVAERAAALVYLADQAMITPHLGLSRRDRIDRPDRMIFDLDPPGNDFTEVQWTAKILRAFLGDLGLVPYVMTTGSRGLHVVVPLDREEGFDAVRNLAHDVAASLAGRHPDRLTVAQRKDKRGNRVFLDTLRNAYGQTGVAPYAVRARPGAPIATPLDWEEALRDGTGPQDYTLANIFRRLGQRDDPWAGIGRRGQSLSAARKARHA